ncbi:MAG TPA: glycosyltransferase family 4 protein [Terracidiphilus sp.]|nr:glycosyltransferase family 4 protein [Terracidiphilus sp.]
MELIPHARIIVISQFFGADQSSVGQFLADFANGAAEAGHDVCVICGATGYAPPDVAASVANGGKDSIASSFSASGGRIHVVRIKTATFSQSKPRKLLSYATFFAGAAWRALWIPRPNVVLTLTAPPGLGWIGWLIKKIRGCSHVCWEMDLYPDIAISLDIPVAAWTSWLLDFPRRTADRVIALGPCMKMRLLQHRIAQDRIVVAENWADGQAIAPQPFPIQPPLRILYSGNFGLAHDIATIREVIVRLANSPHFQFVFAGGGHARKALIEFCRERQISNVSFPGYAPLRDLGASLADCDVGLVTQKLETLGAVVPSKIYGLMAAGRPVLFIGPEAATPSLLIKRFDCGWQMNCGDTDGLHSLLSRLRSDPEEIVLKGRNGRSAFLANYEKRDGVARVMQALGVETTAARRNETVDLLLVG